MSEAPNHDNPELASDAEKERPGMTGRETYNVVADTVTGVNIRVKDNVIQGIAILIFLILGSVIGSIAAPARLPGILMGGFIGLIVGLLCSGLFLALYRGVMHLRGRHD